MKSEIEFEGHRVDEVRAGLYIETRRSPNGPIIHKGRAVILVDEAGRGNVVAIEEGHTSYEIGYHSDTWLISTCFKPFHGTIKITS